MRRLLARIRVLARRYFRGGFGFRSRPPGNVPDDAVIECMSELQRSRNHGRF